MIPLSWLALYFAVGLILGVGHVIRRAQQRYYDHEGIEGILITLFWPLYLVYLAYWSVGQLFDRH